MDLYDNMLDSIQQFPLDANCFERAIRRLNRTCARRAAKYRKVLEGMPSPSFRPFVAARRRLASCLEQKRKIVSKFMQCIKDQLRNLEEYNRMNGSVLQMKRLLPAETAVLHARDNALLESAVCICGSTDGGPMVCCDCPSCPVRWHHFRCVGMAHAPAGGWTCEKCRKLE